MTIKFEVDYSDIMQGIVAVERLGELIRKPIRDALKLSADAIRDDTAKSISTMVFPRSTKGQPPRQETGELLRSLSVKVAKGRATKGSERGYVIGARFYSRFLESGTKKTGWGGPIKPRPFLVPARERHAQEFRTAVEAAIDAAIKKSFGT